MNRCAVTGASGWKNCGPAMAARCPIISRPRSFASLIVSNYCSAKSRRSRPNGMR